MSKPTVELTEAEWSVIKAVWDAQHCTAPAIQERLAQPTGWTYSTVRTIVDRMVTKGVLAAKKVGKQTIYHSAVTREQAQRGELFYALKHAFNGALTPMLQCLLDNHDLNAEEFAKIEALLQTRKQAAKK